MGAASGESGVSDVSVVAEEGVGSGKSGKFSGETDWLRWRMRGVFPVAGGVSGSISELGWTEGAGKAFPVVRAEFI